MVNRINLLMQAKNLTARQFAEEIGIQPSGMSHIMSGRNNPSLDFVMKVIKKWPEINISWLMFGTGEMYAGLPLNAPQSAIKPIQNAGQQTSVQTVTSSVEEDVAPQSDAQDGGEYDLFSQPMSKDAEPLPKRVEQPSPSMKIEEEKIDFPQHVQPSIQQATTQVTSKIVQPTEISIETIPDNYQHNENRVFDSPQPPMPPQTILTKKKIVKMIVLYDDHSFSEYYPE